jgi:uncharacterized protein YdaU (DUF1376 family)
MAKDPAFLFYPNDYIGGTMGLTFEEKGAYMELLMMQFNRGHMTSHMIGQLVGRLWDNLKDKFEIDENGLYFNRRLEEEQIKRKRFTDSRKNNKKGSNQYTKKGGHMTSHMENENENEDENESKDGSKKETYFEILKKIRDEVMVPEPLFNTVIKWLQYKSEKGQTYKPAGMKSFVKKLIKLSNGDETIAELIIEQSMANNWAGIFEFKDNGNNKRTGENAIRRDEWNILTSDS